MDNDLWYELIEKTIQQFETPFYVFSCIPVQEKLNNFTDMFSQYSYSNYLSLKTLPYPPLVKWWKKSGLGIEVTSEYELMAALEENFSPEKIVVNGVAKHSWSRDVWVKGLRVNFDSIYEIQQLGNLAKKLEWLVGIRFHPSIQTDPENHEYSDQFGIPYINFIDAVASLRSYGVDPTSIHIHLRSNIPNVNYLETAICELEPLIKQSYFELNVLDLGGGLPTNNICQLDPAWETDYNINDLSTVVESCYKMFQSLKEIIFENGRYILAGCGALVVKVNDIKEMSGHKYLICDGGRINHAFPSDWEKHKIGIYPNRVGSYQEATVCGPTCMAYDYLGRCNLQSDIRVGDRVVWFDAGAYHLPWETKFSQPSACLIWHDGEKVIQTRRKEIFKDWWKHWG